MQRRLLTHASWLLLTALCSHARAEPALKPGLNWVRLSGAERCLSASELAARVEERLGRSLFVAAREAQIFVDGFVARSAHTFDVTLEVSEPDGRVLGRRELQIQGEDCQLIDDALTLVIAVTLYPDSALPSAGIALDPQTSARLDALFGQEASELDPAALPPPPPAAEVAREPTRAPAAVSGKALPAEPLGLTLSAAATLGLGQLPAIAIGGAAYATYAPRAAFPIELGLTYLPARTARPDQGQGRGSFALMSGSLVACPVQPSVWRGLDLCIGIEAGILRVIASQFAAGNERKRDPIVNVRAAGVYRVPISGALQLRLALLLSAPLLQRNYVFRAQDNTQVSLFRMPQASLRIDAGLAFEF